MQLQNLEIKINEWGESEGKYTGIICYKDDKKTVITVEISVEQADKLLLFLEPILCQAADNASASFKKNLSLALSQQKQLSNE